MLWRNGPAVVIGRHQNPWQECDLRLMRSRGVPLARRRSGGGTVFHDQGNVNLTFFTSKKNYDRQRNLRVVTTALQSLRPELDIRATDRLDILLNGRYKISGTAAKLGRTASYHHCTLLCSADRALLSALLKPSCPDIQSNATASIPSPVTNLLDEDPTLDPDIILNAVVRQYSTEFGCSGLVRPIDPSDEVMFPGIDKMEEELRSWEWRFGRTPRFSIHTSLELRDDTPPSCVTAALSMEVKNGVIERCEVQVPSHWLPEELCEEFGSLLVGSRFCPANTAAVAATMLRSVCEGKEVERRLHQLCQSVISVMG
ncbi:lipoyltransferase 1, mitochondrial [Lampris incognitus]|uniref:lipoyltransferase 1, mitochondrial n=1 Tax=Lampris incognitus TaxID=2546036 RepID=UPI0024B5C082|nr:lipoyltransferase 1, mitochondrial [Lampris incognitus]XP_056157199.1 lipoyltransferase 1, mitochondrial [Lampris incognitus]